MKGSSDMREAPTVLPAARVTGHSSAATAVCIGIAVLIGTLLPVQARITGTLGVRLDDGMLAAWLTSLVGLVFASLLVLIVPTAGAHWPRSRPPSAVARSRGRPCWPGCSPRTSS